MKIYIVRHGQNEDNAQGILNGHRDLPLTNLGRNQAKITAGKIKSQRINFTSVLCSPLVRAKETAEIISSVATTPKPIIEPLLIERDFGIMTGVEQSKIKDLCEPDIIQTNDVTYFLNADNAETFPELLKRASRLLERLENEYQESDIILLVGHGDIGKMLYAAHYNLPWKKVLTQLSLGNADLLTLSSESPKSIN